MADVKWTVYAHICPNGKKYIGITSRKPEDRWQNGHGYRNNRHFYNAIIKYGWNNIEHHILCEGLNKKDAQYMESLFIRNAKSNLHAFGYNRSAGGEGKTGFSPTTETREKIRLKLCGTHRPLEVRKKLSEAHTGKKLSDEHKNKIRMSCKNINGKMVYCVTTGELFPSASEASRRTGISRSGITACCRCEMESCKGTVWMYMERGVECGK